MLKLLCAHLKMLLLAGAIIFMVSCYGYAAEVVDKIVAIVDDEIITQSEVEESLASFIADYKIRYGEEETRQRLEEAKGDALNRLIEEKLILQQAKKRGIQVNESEVNVRLQQVRDKFNSEEEFLMLLSESGLTITKLKDKYRAQLMMKTMINGIIQYNIAVSPTEIASYYHGHKDEFMQPEKVNFRIILLKFKPEKSKIVTASQAKDILKKIRSGEDFATLASEYSQGPNAANGGSMGFLSRGDMVKEIDEALFSLAEGEVSEAIETSLGYNIVKVEKRIPKSELSFEEAAPLVRERLFEREAELVFREFIDKLKENAYVDIK